MQLTANHATRDFGGEGGANHAPETIEEDEDHLNQEQDVNTYTDQSSNASGSEYMEDKGMGKRVPLLSPKSLNGDNLLETYDQDNYDKGGSIRSES